MEPRPRTREHHARAGLGARRGGARGLSQTTLYFVRHGESEANARRVFAGRSDSPLTDEGRRQAEVVADALAGIPVDRVVASDLSRTRDTAAAIARRHGRDVECFAELREIDTGDMTGRSWEEARGRAEWSDDGFVQWPGGESLDDVLRRVLPVVERIAHESPGANIVVVGHGGVTRILVSHFLGLLPRLERSRASNANITKVVAEEGGFRVETLFDARHLVPTSPEARATPPSS